MVPKMHIYGSPNTSMTVFRNRVFRELTKVIKGHQARVLNQKDWLVSS